MKSKILVAVLTTLTSLSAFAANYTEKTWSELEKNRDILISWPSVTFGDLAEVPVNQICRAGDSRIRTLTPVNVCVETREKHEACVLVPESGEEICQEIEAGQALLPEQFLVVSTVCSRTERSMLFLDLQVSREVPAAFNVELLEITPDWDGTLGRLGSKEFRIPACR